MCACTCGYTHVHTSQGWIQGGLWGLETPPPKIYQRSQKSDVAIGIKTH